MSYVLQQQPGKLKAKDIRQGTVVSSAYRILCIYILTLLELLVTRNYVYSYVSISAVKEKKDIPLSTKQLKVRLFLHSSCYVHRYGGENLVMTPLEILRSCFLFSNDRLCLFQETVFEYKVQQNITEERQNQLRWYVNHCSMQSL